MADFLSMGGYGAYVWSAFGVCFVALALLFAASWATSRRRQDELRRWERRAERADEKS